MSESWLWIMVSQDLSKLDRTWEKKKKTEYFRITQLLILLKISHIYINNNNNIHVCRFSHTNF